MSNIVFEQRASDALISLGLHTAHGHLDTAAQQAAADQWSYTHFLGYLLDGELTERHRRNVQISLKFARFPYLKRLEDFDFAAQPSIDRRLIEELASGRFVAEGRNIVLLGPPGVGKTHLAIALGVRVCELGQRVYFTNAMELARRLARATTENRLHRELKNLIRPSVLIIDEVGYLTLDATQASLLFQVICQRYEKQHAIILTSNKALADWAQVFAGDAVMASAALDRLLHRAMVINIRGQSHRMKDRNRSGALACDSRDSQPADPGHTARELDPSSEQPKPRQRKEVTA
jgi:DNA replication protein DnaC